VTRRFEKAKILKVAKTITEPKNATMRVSKVNLEVQNIYIKPLLKP
jgi:hypothetical protein